jgi:hypothetical protein
MASCDLISTCIFFNDKMADMPAISAHYKVKYCQNSYRTCARFRIFLEFGREKVPSNLFPNQEADVAEIAERLRRPPQ